MTVSGAVWHPQLTFGDRLAPVVVGALIALTGAVFVQLWLVPRVETRKRREQRWEDDVLALGQLLTFDQPRVVSDLRMELHFSVALADPNSVSDRAHLAALRTEHREKLRAIREDFDALRTRVDWLTDRVVSLAPRSVPLRQLAGLHRAYYVRHIQLGMLEWRPDLGEELSEEEINDAGDNLVKATSKVVACLKDLAVMAPPRDPLTGASRWKRPQTPSSQSQSGSQSAADGGA